MKIYVNGVKAKTFVAKQRGFIVNKEGDKADSPAVFVYTLPNVVLGEICIRHKIQGENTFFVCQQSNVASLEDYARIVMAKGKLRTCIIGWCELLDGHYQAEGLHRQYLPE